MAIVRVNKDRYTVDSLYQYDYNQGLVIYGLSLPSIPEIHFANSVVKEALVKQATLDNAGVVRVDIPNEILTYPHNIDVYVGVYEGDAFRVWYSFTIPVKPKKKPAEFITPDDETVHSFNALENRLLNMEESNNSFKTTIMNAWNTFKSNVESTVKSLQESFNETKTTVSEYLTTVGNHIKDFANPHKVTAEQTGAPTKTEFTQLKSDLNNLSANDVGALPIQTITCTYGNTDEEIIRGLSENWSKLPNENGAICFTNGADIWYGTYYKYTDIYGSVLMQNASGVYTKKFIKSENKLIDLFDEHNKPSGTYTGNGSATQRVIDIGTIGTMVMILSGMDSYALITYDGTILKQGTSLVALSRNEARLENGKMYLSTTNSILNSSGVTKNYYSL